MNAHQRRVWRRDQVRRRARPICACPFCAVMDQFVEALLSLDVDRVPTHFAGLSRLTETERLRTPAAVVTEI